MAHTEMYAYPYAPECNKVQTLNCNALGKYVLGGADGQTRGADKFATLDIVNINRWLKRIALARSRLCMREAAASATVANPSTTGYSCGQRRNGQRVQ